MVITNKAAVDNCSYNIYDNAKEITYLYIPSKDAYGTYDELYSQAVAYDRDTLIVVAAGPCGKVLADDLSKMGYRVLDLGHLMKDYDWWRKGKDRNERNLAEFCAPD